MKISEFVAQAGKNRSIDMRKLIDTKTYLPINEKRSLIKDILNQCTHNEDGIVRINGIDQYIAFTVKTIAAYTNLEFDEDYIADYDTLCESGMLGPVIETFDGEYKTVLNLLELEKKYLLEENSIEMQIGKFLNGILNSLDGLVGTFAEKVASFDMSKLPVSEEDIAKINQFLNNVK